MRPEDVPAEWVEKAQHAVYEADPLHVPQVSAVRHALAAVLPDIQAQALRDHRAWVERVYPKGLVDRAAVLADLDEMAIRAVRLTATPEGEAADSFISREYLRLKGLTATTEEPTT